MTVTPDQLALFAAAIFVMVASPGPLVAAIAARAASFGFRSGAAMVAGASLADGTWIVAAMLGLGVIAATHAGLLVVLKYIGAAWLIWIGLKLVFGKGSMIGSGEVPPRDSLPGAALSGALLNLGNPKAALFYMALFPGFFDVASLTFRDGLAILAIAMPIGAGSDLCYAWAAAKARGLLTGTPAAKRIDRLSGGVLCGAGAAIAAT
jgi:threonine/homoserine/homoserine lactone efflux protein